MAAWPTAELPVVCAQIAPVSVKQLLNPELISKFSSGMHSHATDATQMTILHAHLQCERRQSNHLSLEHASTSKSQCVTGNMKEESSFLFLDVSTGSNNFHVKAKDTGGYIIDVC